MTLGSIEFGELPAADEIAAGDYQLILTWPDDPTSIVLASDTVTLSGAASRALVGGPTS